MILFTGRNWVSFKDLGKDLRGKRELGPLSTGTDYRGWETETGVASELWGGTEYCTYI